TLWKTATPLVLHSTLVLGTNPYCKLILNPLPKDRKVVCYEAEPIFCRLGKEPVACLDHRPDDRYQLGAFGTPYEGRLKSRELPHPAPTHTSWVYQLKATIFRGLRRILKYEMVRL